MSNSGVRMTRVWRNFERSRQRCFETDRKNPMVRCKMSEQKLFRHRWMKMNEWKNPNNNYRREKKIGKHLLHLGRGVRGKKQVFFVSIASQKMEPFNWISHHPQLLQYEASLGFVLGTRSFLRTGASPNESANPELGVPTCFCLSCSHYWGFSSLFLRRQHSWD